MEALVFDSGGYLFKAGIAGDDGPRAVFPCVVGRHINLNINRCWVGDEVWSARAMITHSSPISRGVVVNWGDMEKIWHHAFYTQLKVDPRDHPVLIAEQPLVPKATSERITQIMFETFEVPGIYFVIQSELVLYAAAKHTGLVFSSGHDMTRIVPVFRGQVIIHAIREIHLGGADITDHLVQRLNQKGNSFSTFADRDIVRDIKEKLCFISLDFQNETKIFQETKALHKSYELPDGEVISLGEELFICTEAYFQPSIVDEQIDGVQVLAHESILACEEDIRKELFNNIVLEGGATMTKGFSSRLENEIKVLAPSSMDVRVVALPERTYSCWIGGSLFASQSTFLQTCITKEEYIAYGPRICHRNSSKQLILLL